MSVTSFIASQRAEHVTPHARCWRSLGLFEPWSYKWHDRPPTARQHRREALDAKVKEIFGVSGGLRAPTAPPVPTPSSKRAAGQWQKRPWPVPWPARASWPVPNAAFGRSPGRTRPPSRFWTCWSATSRPRSPTRTAAETSNADVGIGCRPRRAGRARRRRSPAGRGRAPAPTGPIAI